MDDMPTLLLMDENGNPRVSVSTSKGAQRLTMCDEKDDLRLVLSLMPAGPNMVLLGPGRQPIWSAP